MNHQITKRCVSFPNLITDLLTKQSMFDRNEVVGHLSMIRASSVSINTGASMVAGHTCVARLGCRGHRELRPRCEQHLQDVLCRSAEFTRKALNATVLWPTPVAFSSRRLTCRMSRSAPHGRLPGLARSA